MKQILKNNGSGLIVTFLSAKRNSVSKLKIDKFRKERFTFGYRREERK